LSGLVTIAEGYGFGAKTSRSGRFEPEKSYKNVLLSSICGDLVGIVGGSVADNNPATGHAGLDQN
jgi:hypothetical protein